MEYFHYLENILGLTQILVVAIGRDIFWFESPACVGMNVKKKNPLVWNPGCEAGVTANHIKDAF